MIKSELIRKMAAKSHHLYQQDLDRVVNIVLEQITEALKDGARVELRGFGAFFVKPRGGHTGRNPRTGSAIVVEAKRAACFRAGKEMRVRLNAPSA